MKRRNGWPLLLLVLILGGCDRYHNPADTAKIKDLQTQLDTANSRAGHAEAQLAADVQADRARFAAVAERSARAQQAQAMAAEDQADRAHRDALLVLGCETGGC
jgi:outer membrane murein-binding lipoprotein Lpp